MKISESCSRLSFVRLGFGLPAPVLLLFVAACNPTPAGPAVVTATVLDSSGQPLSDIYAELSPLSDTTAVSALTDSAGRVRLSLAATGPGIAKFAADPENEESASADAYLLLEPSHVDIRIRLEEEQARVDYPVAGSRMARWGRAAMLRRDIERRHREAYGAWVRGGQSGGLEAGLEPLADSAHSLLAAERDDEVRAALWLALLVAASRDSTLTIDADRLLREVRPEAAVWDYNAFHIARLIHHAAILAESVPPGAGADTASGTQDPDDSARQQLANRRAAAYLDRVIEAHPGVRPRLLLGALRLATTTDRLDAAAAYYERLVGEFPDSYEAEAAADMAPGRQLAVGDQIPDVAFNRLDSTAPPITAAELAGPATLVDFWAIWCTPCLAEIPGIRAAHEQFAERGLRIVSISFDETREQVHAFQETHPMPWDHAFVGSNGLSRGPVSEAYALTGLPYVILVGPDGTIQALEGELRGERLTETLERVLADPAPGS